MRPHSRDCHAWQDTQPEPAPQLGSWQREEAGPGEAVGSSCGARPWRGAGTGCSCPMQAGVPGSLAQVGWGLSLIYLLLPPIWAPQPLITSCRSIPGPLCNSPQWHHRTGLAARCARTRANRISQAACLPPALCLQCPACSSAPPGAPVQGPPGRRLCPRGSPALGLAPCPAGVLGKAQQPQPAGPGGWLGMETDASQMASDTASSSAGWSPLGPGRVGMLRAMGILLLLLCQAGYPRKNTVTCCGEPWQHLFAGGCSEPQPGQELAWQAGCLARPPQEQRQAGRAPLLANSTSSHAGTCQPGPVSPYWYCG
ncbi:uncharacterized protein LOC129736781 [Falco cherrug]|uniref:uncharacterized protein LOC129736781 n=1 Tax=Falco cherrug TaxID=345164 RepID=UPI00247A9694|nr:uncharacterized protein LOC129736781 [Falco cherrug]